MIRYTPLFHVDIAHDYFLSRGSVVFEAQSESQRSALAAAYSVRQFLEIVVDDTTAATLAGHRMILRQAPSGFLVAVQRDSTAPDIRPAIPLAGDFTLTFGLKLGDARFANYTELGSNTTGFHRFGNDSQNRVAGVNYLSRRIAAFDSTRRYVAGEVRSQPAGPTFDLFLALRDTGPSALPVAADWRRIPADTHDPAGTYQAGAIVLSANRLFRALVDDPGTDLTAAADWQPVGVLGNQYASAADAALLVGALVELDVSAASLAQVTVRVLRGAQTAVAFEQTYAVSQGTLDTVQLDLRGFAPGEYRCVVLDGTLTAVPGASRSIYLAPAPRALAWCGVVEIGLGNGDFALLDAGGALREPRYTLRFLNRATRWRYIFSAAQAVGTGAEVALEAGSDRRLVTAAPQPLTRFGAGVRLQADAAATTLSEEVLLPLPGVTRIRRQNAEWFSEVHLSNLTVGT